MKFCAINPENIFEAIRNDYPVIASLEELEAAEAIARMYLEFFTLEEEDIIEQIQWRGMISDIARLRGGNRD